MANAKTQLKEIAIIAHFESFIDLEFLFGSESVLWFVGVTKSVSCSVGVTKSGSDVTISGFWTYILQNSLFL